MVQAVALSQFHSLLRRPEEIQVSFEDEEKARAPGSHSEGQLSPHGRFTSSKDARLCRQEDQPWPRTNAGLWRGHFHHFWNSYGDEVGSKCSSCLLLCCFQVERSEQSFFYFLLTNQSKFRMDVNYELTGNVNLLQYLKADHQNVVIDVENHLQTSLLFSPKGFCNLQDVNLKIKVREDDSPRCW